MPKRPRAESLRWPLGEREERLLPLKGFRIWPEEARIECVLNLVEGHHLVSVTTGTVLPAMQGSMSALATNVEDDESDDDDGELLTEPARSSRDPQNGPKTALSAALRSSVPL